MAVRIVRPRPEEFEATARVLLRAFDDIADQHGFPRDLSGLDVARDIVEYKSHHPGTFGAIASIGDRVTGSIFMLQIDPIGGIGPVTVDPREQGSGIGRLLVEAAISAGSNLDGIRLTQDAYNVVSLSLYAGCGFALKEPLVEVTGRPRSLARSDLKLHPVTASDVGACANLYRRVHGTDRTAEIRDMLNAGASPHYLVRDGRITAYTSRVPIVYDSHAAADTEEDLRELVLHAAARSNGAASMVVPTRQASFFRWCLAEGFRVVKPMNLMALGVYHEPKGAWFPSVLY